MLVPGDTALGDEGYRLDGSRAAASPLGACACRGPLPRRADAAAAPARRDREPTAGSRARGACRAGRSTTGRASPGAGRCSTSRGTSSGSPTSSGFIDLMALYKLNRLHLHLTDDQGWRLAIRSLAAAREARREHRGRGRRGRVLHAAPVRASSSPTPPTASSTVVPEIDMPGHINAALASYAKLTCDGVAPRPLHGHRGRVQLALHPQAGDVRASSTTSCARSRPSHPGRTCTSAATRRTRPTPDGVPSPSCERVAGHRARRTASGWWGGRRSRKTPRCAGRRSCSTGRTPPSRRGRSRRVRRLILSPATKAYLDMKYAPGFPLGLTLGRDDDRAGRVRVGSRPGRCPASGRPTSWASRRRSGRRR